MAAIPDICLTLVMAGALAHDCADDQQGPATAAMQKYLIGIKIKSFLGFRAADGSSWTLCHHQGWGLELMGHSMPR